MRGVRVLNMVFFNMIWIMDIVKEGKVRMIRERKPGIIDTRGAGNIGAQVSKLNSYSSNMLSNSSIV